MTVAVGSMRCTVMYSGPCGDGGTATWLVYSVKGMQERGEVSIVKQIERSVRVWGEIVME